MTISKDYSINMTDIKSVRLVCHNCKAALNLPPTDIKKDPPEHCPNCGADWFGHRTIEQQNLKHLLSSFRFFMARTDTPVCQLQLEVSQPE